MNYYIADLHIGCINKHEGRTLDHDRILKENWNSVVHNNDTVYILGDIGREGTNAENEYLCQVLFILKGKKVLIRGNHDKLKDARIRKLFSEVYDYKEVFDNFGGKNVKLVLSHYPILMWNGQHKGWIHFYGHVHNTDEEVMYDISLKSLNTYFLAMAEEGRTDCPQARAFNVGAMKEYMDYTPRTAAEIIEKGGYQFGGKGNESRN